MLSYGTLDKDITVLADQQAYIHQFCVKIKCCSADLPRIVANWDLWNALMYKRWIKKLTHNK